jgi:hypothetical protein
MYWIFFFSLYSSVFTGNLIWVVLNAGLILTSYLADKGYHEIDYVCIFLINLCYLNDVYTNTILVCAAVYEFYDKKTINTIKNMACGLGIIKCCICCFKLDILIGINLVWFALIGIHVYRARIVYYEKHKNYCDNLFYDFLTIIWRLCALIILMSASYTMEKRRNALFKI